MKSQSFFYDVYAIFYDVNNVWDVLDTFFFLVFTEKLLLEEIEVDNKQ